MRIIQLFAYCLILFKCSTCVSAYIYLESFLITIATYYEINFRFTWTKDFTTKVISFPSNLDLPCTIEYVPHRSNTESENATSTKILRHHTTSKFSLQKIQIFIIFPLDFNHLRHAIAKSGHGYWDNSAVFYSIQTESNNRAHVQIVEKDSKMGHVGVFGTLVLLNLKEKQICDGRQVSYLGPGPGKLKRVEIDQVSHPLLLWERNAELFSNGYGINVNFQIFEYSATKEQILENPRLGDCQIYFDSEPKCAPIYPLMEIMREKLNVTLESKC